MVEPQKERQHPCGADVDGACLMVAVEGGGGGQAERQQCEVPDEVLRGADFVEGDKDERLDEHAKGQVAAQAPRAGEQQGQLRRKGKSAEHGPRDGAQRREEERQEIG